MKHLSDSAAGLETALTFPLINVLIGRRSRRFSLGGSLPDGSLAYTSTAEPLPLSELEQLLLLTNPTGLPGVFAGFCPPHYPTMRAAAVDAFVERKFGPGGPFHAETPGPWRATPKVRTDAPIHSEEAQACVAHMAQAIYDRFGRFPATTPSIFARIFLQAHHLDLGFYDQHFSPGAYLQTHAHHMANWHPKD